MQIKREKDYKNRNAWPFFIGTIIVKILDNHTPLSTVVKNLESTCTD